MAFALLNSGVAFVLLSSVKGAANFYANPRILLRITQEHCIWEAPVKNDSRS